MLSPTSRGTRGPRAVHIGGHASNVTAQPTEPSRGLVERAAAKLPDPLFVRTIAAVHPRVEREMRRVISACPPEGTALDVGAWYGPWTRHLSRRVDSVVAFEANPIVAAVLRKTAPANAVVHPVAVSDRDDEMVELAVSGGRGQEGRSSLEPNLGEGFDHVMVPVRRLDSFEFARVRLIKIDVEGHELAVLRGAEALLERDHPVLVVELDSRNGEVGPPFGLLGEKGYAAFVLLGRRWNGVVPDELVERQRAALAKGHRDGYIASALRHQDDFVNNVIFVHPDSGWSPD